MESINEKLREYFKKQWPIVHKTLTGIDPAPWNDIRSDAAALKKIGKLRFPFKDQEKIFDSGNTNKWDFSLLNNVLRNSTLKFVCPKSPESSALKSLSEYRNKLAHSPNGWMPSASYGETCATVRQALGVFGVDQHDSVPGHKKVLICRTYGPKVENMPHHVKHDVCLMLNAKQLIKGNDYRRVANEVGLEHYEVNNLPTENPMDEVFDVMISQVKTVKYFVDILHRIDRGDVLDKMYEMALLQTSNSTAGRKTRFKTA
jgi:hypothetical protein